MLRRKIFFTSSSLPISSLQQCVQLRTFFSASTAKTPSEQPQLLRQRSPKQHQSHKRATFDFAQEENDNGSFATPSSPQTITQSENLVVINQHQSNENKHDSSQKQNPFEAAKPWKKKHHKNNNNTNNYKNSQQQIQKAKKSLMEQFPEYFSNEGENLSALADSNNDSTNRNYSNEEKQVLAHFRTSSLSPSDPQLEVKLRELPNEDGETSSDNSLHQLQHHRSLNFNDSPSSTNSNNPTSLVHPDDVELTPYQRELLAENRAQEYSAFRQNFAKVVDGHHDLEGKCHLLAALHRKTAERRIRLHSDIYEDYFLTFVRYGESIFDAGKEGRVLPHNHSFADDAKNKMSDAFNKDLPSLFLKQIANFNPQQRWSTRANTHNNNNIISSSPVSVSGQPNKLLQLRAASIRVSDFGFSEVVWDSYKYMLECGAKPTHRTLQHVMRCLQFGGVQGGKAELERRAHQLMVENLGPKYKVVPTAHTIAYYIEICANAGSMHIALAAYIHAIKEFNLRPSATISTTILNGFLKNHLRAISNSQQQIQSPDQEYNLKCALKFMKHINNVAMDVILLNSMLNVLRYSSDPLACFAALRTVMGEESLGSTEKYEPVVPLQLHTVTTLLDAWKRGFRKSFPETDKWSTDLMNRYFRNDAYKNQMKLQVQVLLRDSERKQTVNDKDETNNSNKEGIVEEPSKDLQQQKQNSFEGKFSITQVPWKRKSLNLINFMSEEMTLNPEEWEKNFASNFSNLLLLSRELRFLLQTTTRQKIRSSRHDVNKFTDDFLLLIKVASDLKFQLMVQRAVILKAFYHNNHLRSADEAETDTKIQWPDLFQQNVNFSEASKTTTNVQKFRETSGKLNRIYHQLKILRKVEMHFTKAKIAMNLHMKKKGIRLGDGLRQIEQEMINRDGEFSAAQEAFYESMKKTKKENEQNEARNSKEREFQTVNDIKR